MGTNFSFLDIPSGNITGLAAYQRGISFHKGMPGHAIHQIDIDRVPATVPINSLKLTGRQTDEDLNQRALSVSLVG